MYISTYFVSLLVAASSAEAFDISSSFSSIKRSVIDSVFKRDGCPSVWSDVSKTLTGEFLSNGQCNDMARAAIRAAFHDCFNGACDGSLILANECSNDENKGLEDYCNYLGPLAKDKNVGTADLIQFAGAHAIKTCPLGPTVPAYVGRKDSSSANPTGVLPSAFANGDDLLKLFQSKGFSATDLAALIGAHSTAKQFFTDPSKSGAAMDSTPGTWDVTYYGQTLTGTAPYTLPADKSLSQQSEVSVPFKAFALNQGGWAAAFVPAMSKMSLMGVDGGSSSLTDCTSALPGGSLKRDVKANVLGFKAYRKW